MTTGVAPHVSAADVERTLGPDRARTLIERALLDGFDPSSDPPRHVVDAGTGHLLLMPSNIDGWTGVKIASVAPLNPDKGLPRIQATYLLMDSKTLTPQLIIDGSALTSVRTAAMTAVAVDRLSAPDASRLVIFGSGPQAVNHAVALSRIRKLTQVALVGRSTERLDAAVAQLDSRGIHARKATPDALIDADIVVTATSAGSPLFDDSQIKPGACVAAIGSHEPNRRELPGDLMQRAFVVVEDKVTALREAGDVILAAEEGKLDPAAICSISDLVLGRRHRSTDRPNVFKGTGMSWQDLVVASGLAQNGPR